MYTLTAPNGKTIQLSNEDLEAIYNAMDDYRHHGEEEENIADSIQSKLSGM